MISIVSLKLKKLISTLIKWERVLYKLVQFLNDYINFKGIKTSIEVCSLITQNSLSKLRYKYKNRDKDLFIYHCKLSNLVKSQKNILIDMENLKPWRLKSKK